MNSATSRTVLATLAISASALAEPLYLPTEPKLEKTTVVGRYDDTSLDAQLRPRDLPAGATASSREALFGLVYVVHRGKKQTLFTRRAPLIFKLNDGEPLFVDDLYYCGPTAAPCGGVRWSYAPGGLRQSGQAHATPGHPAPDAPEGAPAGALLVPGAPPASLAWGDWRLHFFKLVSWLEPAVGALKLRTRDFQARDTWSYEVLGPRGTLFRRSVSGKAQGAEHFAVALVEDEYFCGERKPAPCGKVAFQYDATGARSRAP